MQWVVTEQKHSCWIRSLLFYDSGTETLAKVHLLNRRISINSDTRVKVTLYLLKIGIFLNWASLRLYYISTNRRKILLKLYLLK